MSDCCPYGPVELLRQFLGTTNVSETTDRVTDTEDTRPASSAPRRKNERLLDSNPQQTIYPHKSSVATNQERSVLPLKIVDKK